MKSADDWYIVILRNKYVLRLNLKKERRLEIVIYSWIMSVCSYALA
jgi:hypothetical protein